MSLPLLLPLPRWPWARLECRRQAYPKLRLAAPPKQRRRRVGWPPRLQQLVVPPPSPRLVLGGRTAEGTRRKGAPTGLLLPRMTMQVMKGRHAPSLLSSLLFGVPRRRWWTTPPRRRRFRPLPLQLLRQQQQ